MNRPATMTTTTTTLGAVLAGAGVLLGAAGTAGAQTFGYDDRTRYETPQNFAFELRFGNYIPRVDQQLGLEHGPYWDIFSTCSTYNSDHSMCAAANTPRGLPFRPFLGAEFDWQAVRIGPVMSLGVGLGLGLNWSTERAPTTMSMMTPTSSSCADTSNPNCWTLSGETTTLWVVPATLLAVARFDGLARHVRYLPIVPYVKAGFATALWWVSNSSGIAQANGNFHAIDFSFGWHVAGGLQLMLDVFEPGLARQFDANMGVNHSYAFFELYYTELGAFGANQLNVGTMSWVAGLAVEF